MFGFQGNAPMKPLTEEVPLPPVARGSQVGTLPLLMVPAPLTLQSPVISVTPLMEKAPDWFQLPLA
jgi:hypothetical protein